MATSTFRLGLSKDSELRDSLTKRPPENIRQLMRRIEEYKRLEDDWQQIKGKAPATLQYTKDPWSGDFQQRTRINVTFKEINVTIKEPIHKILERIKNEPYFRWPSKMGGDPTRRN